MTHTQVKSENEHSTSSSIRKLLDDFRLNDLRVSDKTPYNKSFIEDVVRLSHLPKGVYSRRLAYPPMNCVQINCLPLSSDSFEVEFLG